MATRKVAIGTMGNHTPFGQPIIQEIIEMDDVEGTVYKHEQGFNIVVQDGQPDAQSERFGRPRTDIWTKWFRESSVEF